MMKQRGPENGRPIRKVLFFGKSMSTSGTTRAIAEALRGEGMLVKWINCATWRRWLGQKTANTWLRRVAQRFEPDLVFSFFCDIPIDLLAELDSVSKTVIWNEDWSHDSDLRLQGWLDHCDLLCVSNKRQAEGFKRLGARRVEFVLSGFSPEVHRPARAAGGPHRFEVSYIGSPGHNDIRAEMVLRVAQSLPVHVFGRGWDAYHGRARNLVIHGPVGPGKFARICAESKVLLGMNATNTIPLYFSNRTWMTLGCRGFHLTHYVPDLEEVFEEGVHLDWFRDFDEMMEKLERYLREDGKRAKIAEQGFRYVRENHTYGHRMRQVRGYLEETAGVRRQESLGAHVAAAPVFAPPRNGRNPSAVFDARRNLAE